MILLLFPTMTVIAIIFIGAAISIVIDEWSRTPFVALILGVIIKLRFSSEVLPIMWKYTLVSLMICFIIRTPNCFKMKHIEIWIFDKFVYKLYWDFRGWMCKWAILTIFTFSSVVNIGWTKFRFIFIRMIKLLDSIMRFLTSITVWTFLSSDSERADFWLVRTKSSSLILLLIMIIRTSLEIMAVWIYRTWVNLK